MSQPDLFTQEEFSLLVTEMVLAGDGLVTYIEAVCDICERRGIHPEDVNPLIDKSLKARLREEAVRLKLIVDDSSGDLSDLVS